VDVCTGARTGAGDGARWSARMRATVQVGESSRVGRRVRVRVCVLASVRTCVDHVWTSLEHILAMFGLCLDYVLTVS
jgi:hypothetical protein